MARAAYQKEQDFEVAFMVVGDGRSVAEVTKTALQEAMTTMWC